MNRIYLDNAATTKLHPKVLEAMLPFLKEDFGNPSSIHSLGRKPKIAIEETRELAAEFINCDASEIYFTSSGTEGNNFALFGIAKTEFTESNRKKLLTTKVEHKSVLDSFKELNNLGYQTNFLKVSSDGILIEDELKEKLTGENVSLVSIIHTNNETGIINNIPQLSEIVKNHNAYFHTDAVQAFGKEPLNVKKLGIDSLTGSAHKLHGPKGIGLAYIKNGTPMSSFIYGGSQERNRRAGTENVAGIIGFGEAIKLAVGNMQASKEHAVKLKQYFINELNVLDSYGIKINESDYNSPFILSVTFLPEFYKTDSEAMLMYLDINGIAASSGAACSSGTVKPSHVIKAMYNDDKLASATIRFSFSIENTFKEIDYVMEILQNMLKNIKK